MSIGGRKVKVAFLCSSRPTRANGEARPNWAFGYHGALRKLGWDVQAFEGDDPPSFDDFDAIFVGSRDIPLSAQNYLRLKSLGKPVFLEAAAMAPEAARACGWQASERSDFGAIRYVDPAASSAMEPFVDFVGGPPGAHPLEKIVVSGRYEPPDPREFRLAEEDQSWQDVAEKIALRQVFANRRQLRADALDLVGAPIQAFRILAMAAAAAKLEAGSHARQLQDDCDALSVALRESEARVAPTVIAMLSSWRRARDEGVPEGGFDGASAVEELIDAFSTAPLIRNAAPAADLAEGDLLAWIETRSTVEAIGAAAWASLRDPGLADKVLQAIVDSRLDRDTGNLFSETAAGVRTFVSHPLLTTLLICLLPRLRAPTTGSLTVDPATTQLNAAWARPPDVAAYRPAEDVETILATVSAATAPAAPGALDLSGPTVAGIWSDGDVVVFGHPVFSHIGYAQTTPPLKLTLTESNHHWALILEHCVAAIVRSRLGVAEERATPTLVVRHDADRPIEEHELDRLLAEYARRGVRSSWYWIHSRTNAEQMRRLSLEGHEVGVHALKLDRKSEERAVIETSADVTVWGETYHGAGADYTYGGRTASMSVDAGYAYAELNPFNYDARSVVFPVVNEQLDIELLTDCANVTFAYSTDAAPSSRKASVTATPDFALALLKAGYSVTALNHPDMNFDKLTAFMDAAEQIGVVYGASADVAAQALRRGGCSPLGRVATRSFGQRDVLRVAWSNASVARQPSGVFVVGAPRTGTTLLMNALCTLPGAMPGLPEMTPMISIMNAYRMNKQLEAASNDAFYGGEAAVDRFFRDTMARFIACLQDRHGDGLPILKSPYLSQHFMDLARALPEFSFICMMRHPSLIVRSMREWGRKAAARGAKHHYDSASDEELYDEVGRYFRPILAVRDADVVARLRFVRYEDLTDAPARSLADVARHCGARGSDFNLDTPFGASTVNYQAESGAAADAITELYGRPIEQGKGQEELRSLTAEEKSASERLLRPVVSAFYQDV